MDASDAAGLHDAVAKASSPQPRLLPILIGITGKRDLPGSAESVKQRLLETFRKLDDTYKHVPKVLLTGAAFGADTLAAEVLIGNEQAKAEFARWSICVILPFERDLFEQDFRARESKGETQAQADERLDRLKSILDAPDRVIVRTLPRLHLDKGRPAAGCPYSGSPRNVDPEPPDPSVARRLLDKDCPEPCSTYRHNHYEQVGQLIAEAATILIAVMDGGERAKTSEADGGTARIVAFRRTGRPDEAGTDVAERSDVLRRDWGSLVDPPAGFVWLIEPEKKSSTKVSGWWWRRSTYPVLVVPPGRLVSRVKGDRDHPSEHSPYQDGDLGGRSKGKEGSAYLRASLVLARAFDIFHRRGATQAAGAVDALSFASPARAIEAIRDRITEPQGTASHRSTDTFRAIAVLFVFAVLLLEIFVKFWNESIVVLGLYLVVSVIIYVLVAAAQRAKWQPKSEDYRAVSEMLRVQTAWWAAGRHQRVDHLHLQSIDAELARIREAARTVLGWVWLGSNWPTARPVDTDWTKVRGGETIPRPTKVLVKGKPRDWIGGQIVFLAKKQRTNLDKARRSNAVVWTLFATAGWLAAALWLWLAFEGTRDLCTRWSQSVGRLFVATQPARSIISLLIWCILAAGLVWLRRHFAVRHAAEGEIDRTPSWRRIAVSVVAGLLVAFVILLAIQPAAVIVQGLAEPKPHLSREHHLKEVAEHLTVLVFVVLSAAAGACRYVAEKLDYAALALEYREALERFEKAERLLARMIDPRTNRPRKNMSGTADSIVHDLGMLALRENEAWLKARRERPLSPVVG